MAETKLINNLSELAKVAQENKWTKSYDKDLDFLYWGNQEKMATAKVLKVSQEVFLYIDELKNIEGVGVEYLTSNFIEHKPEYKDLTNLFTQEAENGVFTIPYEKDPAILHRFEDFAKDIVLDVFRENLNHKQNGFGIEELANLAIAQ